MQLTPRLTRPGEAGFSLIEVLITVVILAFGLLGLAALQAKVHGAGIEAVQRSQALVILQDMAARINANRVSATSYLTTGVGQTTLAGCDGATDVALVDLCAWSELLKGAAVVKDGTSLGGLIRAQGCIEEVSVGPPRTLRVTVVWQGLVPTAAPSLDCGEEAYGDETLRRSVSVLVSIADLTAKP